MELKKRRLADDLAAQGFGHRLRFRMDVQLFVNVLHVEGDGVGADMKHLSRGLEVVAFRKELKQADLVRREIMLSLVRRAKTREQPDYAASYFRRHRRAALGGLLQRVKQFGRWCLLQQIARSSGAERGKDTVVVVV